MDIQDIKKEMMKLWKDTFHDSDNYIRLIFDEYFDSKYIEYEIVNDKVVSALLAIPYKFGNYYNNINAVYLCGLATDREHRGKGIMSDLIKRICTRMKAMGYSFVFLIPADNGLIKYYQDRYFVDAFYKLKFNYLPHHNFSNYNLNNSNKIKNNISINDNIISNNLTNNVFELIEKNKLLVEDNLSTVLDNNIQNINDIISFILEIERYQKGFKIYHDKSKLYTIISECIISGGNVFYSKNSENNIDVVLLCSIEEDEIIVNKIFSKNKSNHYAVLNYISKKYPDYRITVYHYSLIEKGDVIMDYHYKGTDGYSNAENNLSKVEGVFNYSQLASVYGMVKILNFCEILKFMTKETNGLNFSILVKGDEGIDYILYKVKNDSVEEERISPDQVEYNSKLSSAIMSKDNFSALLFRKGSSSHLISEAFGFPSLKGEIYLMLD